MKLAEIVIIAFLIADQDVIYFRRIYEFSYSMLIRLFDFYLKVQELNMWSYGYSDVSILFNLSHITYDHTAFAIKSSQKL